MGVQSPAGELRKEAGSVKRKKVDATGPVLNHWKVIYHFHLANFYGDPLQNFDF